MAERSGRNTAGEAKRSPLNPDFHIIISSSRNQDLTAIGSRIRQRSGLYSCSRLNE